MAKPNAIQTPAGVAVHPWINRPDTKYNEDGVFKLDLVFDADLPEVQALKAKVTEAAEAKFKELTEALSPAERKKWSVYLPYRDEEDQQTGEPTGRIIFSFKKNARIRVDGELIDKRVYIYGPDGKSYDDEPNIFGGSTLKAAFTFRDVKVNTSKVAGVRLDFFAVQVVKLSSGGRSPFSAIDSEADAPDEHVEYKRSQKAGDDDGY